MEASESKSQCVIIVSVVVSVSVENTSFQWSMIFQTRVERLEWCAFSYKQSGKIENENGLSCVDSNLIFDQL